MTCVHIEVSKMSREKYEFDEKTNRMTLDRVLPVGVHYPYNYGYIPQTTGHDGDPLDVMVVTDVVLVPSTWVKVRMVGYLDMEDEKGQDEKLIGFIANDPTWSHVTDMAEVPQSIKDAIAKFFGSYKSLEKNKWSKVHGWHDRQEAFKLIEDCIQSA